MQSNVWESSINFIQVALLFVVFFTLPLSPKITSISIALLFVFSFFYTARPSLKTLPKLYFLFPLFFLLHVFSLVFSENIEFWGKDLETKLSFVVVPIIFFNLNGKLAKFKEYMYFTFIVGVLVSALLSYLKGIDCWNVEHARFCFESSHLAFNFHPSYLSMYYMVAIIISWHVFFKSKYKKTWGVISVIITVVLSYFIYHFYSVGPWISFMSVVFLLLFYFFYKRKQIFRFIISILIIGGITYFGISKLELFESDFRVIKTELSDYFNSPKKYYEENKGNTSSSKARIIIWGITIELLNEHKFGVGSGDVKDVLIKRYSDLKLDEYVESKLNPHNQYLQTSLALGILTGLFLFCSMLLFIYSGIKNSNPILISVSTMLLVSMLFESVLEKQAGVVFFMVLIFYSLTAALQSKKTLKTNYT